MTAFEVRTMINASVDVVFDLARDIDAHTRSMAQSNERAVAGVTSGLIELGESVTWKARHFGIPFRMTSKIVEMDKPRYFVDAQTAGPFAAFEHRHRFDPTDGGGTLMIDDVTFTSPLGPIGSLVDRAFLGGYMERLIKKRGLELKLEAELETN